MTQHNNRISFLATGNEIVQGDIQDSNGSTFAKIIHEKGGNVYQRMQVCDRQSEIVEALRYLLTNSEVVIITGGLGPTSDDATRFAVAEVIEQPLLFNEDAWEHIMRRLKKFNIAVSESNRQQALFPADAIRLHNHHGSADGAHLRWRGKHLFMLPGPPRECMPMFEQDVLPALNAQGLFKPSQHYRWLTLGLIEGEIASRIDDLAKNYAVETAYRWHYPYLEIKVAGQEENKIEELIAQIETELAPYLVSQDGRDAFTVLAETLANYPSTIPLLDELSTDTHQIPLPHPAIQRIQRGSELPEGLVVKVSASYTLRDGEAFSGTMTLTCEAYVDRQRIYQHDLSIPNRGPEVMEYGHVYLAWQISRVIRSLKR